MPLAKDLATEKENNSTVNTRASSASLESLTAANRVNKAEKRDTTLDQR